MVLATRNVEIANNCETAFQLAAARNKFSRKQEREELRRIKLEIILAMLESDHVLRAILKTYLC